MLLNRVENLGHLLYQCGHLLTERQWERLAEQFSEYLSELGCDSTTEYWYSKLY